MRIRDYVSLLPVAMEHGVFSLKASLRELGHYGSRGWWWKFQLLLYFSYLLERPYTIMEKNRGKVPVGEDNLIYGETPLLTMKELITSLSLHQHDVFFDLGCGRGLACFYTAMLFGMPCHGIDIIPQFIDKALMIKHFMNLPQVRFSRGNVLDADLSEGSIFFIAGTTFDDATLTALGKKLDSLPGRRTIISLSAPLPAPSYTTVRSGKYAFSWGMNSVYVQEKKQGKEQEKKQEKEEKKEEVT